MEEGGSCFVPQWAIMTPKPSPVTGRYMATQIGARAKNLLLESNCMSCVADGSGQLLTCFGPWFSLGCLN
jgi:hypothetical protein